MVARDDQIGLRRARSLHEPLQQVRNRGISRRGWDSRCGPRLLTEGISQEEVPDTSTMAPDASAASTGSTTSAPPTSPASARQMFDLLPKLPTSSRLR
ncbi:hypothetical protein TIFTF001_012072 [Ficus carica]|uniref:Uncharacterized protein n=1 Tax=Ficus carica TaxID=3494 RepID=A0AA88D3D7_FICCA|nr:hypothetical protein TIFTF001_012072 [Ficus carica]